MQIMLLLQVEDLQHLPPHLLDKLRANLPSTSVAGQVEYGVPQPQWGQPLTVPQQPAVAPVVQYQQPQAPPVVPQQPAPPVLPQGFAPQQKVPVPGGTNGNMLIPPTMGHQTQQNVVKDVMTGQVSAGQVVSTGPSIPQFQNAPVNVVPHGAQPPQQAAAPVMNVNRASVLQAAIHMRTNNQDALTKAIATSQIGALGNLTEDNASGFYQHLLHHSGGVI